jgi:hypothetical protein
MASNPSTAPTRGRTDEQKLIAAANTVFGALELIAEMPCNHDTQQNVLGATRAAHARLAELGLTREELLAPGARAEIRTARWAGSHPRAGRVIHLSARRSAQSG